MGKENNSENNLQEMGQVVTVPKTNEEMMKENFKEEIKEFFKNEVKAVIKLENEVFIYGYITIGTILKFYNNAEIGTLFSYNYDKFKFFGQRENEFEKIKYNKKIQKRMRKWIYKNLIKLKNEVEGFIQMEYANYHYMTEILLWLDDMKLQNRMDVQDICNEIAANLSWGEEHIKLIKSNPLQILNNEILEIFDYKLNLLKNSTSNKNRKKSKVSNSEKLSTAEKKCKKYLSMQENVYCEIVKKFPYLKQED